MVVYQVSSLYSEYAQLKDTTSANINMSNNNNNNTNTSMKISVTNTQIENVVYFLEMTPRWVSAIELAQEMGHNIRVIRFIANQSGGRIISGNLGYKTTVNASPEEIETCVNRLSHQAQEMFTRAIAILTFVTKSN